MADLKPIRPYELFVAYKIAGKPHLLAAYTCTPLVKFPKVTDVDCFICEVLEWLILHKMENPNA